MSSRWFLWGTRPSLMSNHSRFSESNIHQVEWTCKKIPQLPPAPATMQPHVEIRRKECYSVLPTDADSLALHTIRCSTSPHLCTDGDRPVDLYQRGTWLWTFLFGHVHCGQLSTSLYCQRRPQILSIQTLQWRNHERGVSRYGPSLRFRLRLSCKSGDLISR